MEVSCKKIKDIPRLSYNITLSEDERKKYGRYEHEIKCFLMFGEDRLKDTNQFIFYNAFYDINLEKNCSNIKFEYFDRLNHALFLCIEMIFNSQNNFVFSNVFLEHRNSDKFIGKTRNEFRENSCSHVKEIIELLLNREKQGSFCNNCVHLYMKRLTGSCINKFTRMKIK